MGTNLHIKSIKRQDEWYCLGLNRAFDAWKKFVDDFAKKYPDAGYWEWHDDWLDSGGDSSQEFEYDLTEYVVECLKEYAANLRKHPKKIFYKSWIPGGDRIYNKDMAAIIEEIIEHADVGYLLINKDKYKSLPKDSYEYEKIQQLKDKYDYVKMTHRDIVVPHKTNVLPQLDDAGIPPDYNAAYAVVKPDAAVFRWY